MLIEKEDGETLVCHSKTISGVSYTLLLRIDEFLAAGREIGAICQAMMEELKDPKRTFLTF